MEEEGLILYIYHHKMAKAKSTANPHAVLPPELWACILVEVPGSCWLLFVSEQIIASLVSRCARCILNAPGGQAAVLQGHRQWGDSIRSGYHPSLSDLLFQTCKMGNKTS